MRIKKNILKLNSSSNLISLSKINLLKITSTNFFHFDILARNVYITLFRKYIMAGEKKILYARM